MYFTELSKYGISDKKIETMFPLGDFQGAALDDKFKVAHAIKKRDSSGPIERFLMKCHKPQPQSRLQWAIERRENFKRNQ